MSKFAAALASVLVCTTPALAQQSDEADFRSLYRELVETNTTASEGSCTLAAERMAARLKEAGLPERDVTLFVPTGHPNDGGLVAMYPGTDPKAKAILLLAHIDVVEARREDWTRDPFKLIEEGGYFYARGAFDDKAQAATFTDLLIRLKRESFRARRGIKIALTCGEEGGGQLNGAKWLADNRRDLIDAEFAINEGAGGALDGYGGKPVVHNIQAGEKTSVNFRLEATNPGGHSSRPVPDNAIYHIVRAVDRVSRYQFPVQLNATTRAYFTAMANVRSGDFSKAMKAIVADPQDSEAYAVLAKDTNLRAILGTTCVATRLEAGHADNALPQRARATINCRIFPGVSRETVGVTLSSLIADPAVSITVIDDGRGQAVVDAPILTPKVLDPIKRISSEMWPGIPVVPIMQAGASDAPALIAAGIPTFGVSGIFYDPDLGRMHGLNERIGVKALMDSREFIYRLVKLYARTK